MAYVLVISALFLIAGIALLSKLSKGNVDSLEHAVCRARYVEQEELNSEKQFKQHHENFYVHQFHEAVSSR